MSAPTCDINGCDRTKYCRGWCRRHYSRWLRHGNPLTLIEPTRTVGCAVEGCDRKHHAYGYCTMHAQRYKKYGDPLMSGPRNPGRPRAEAPGYSTVHRRLTRDIGKATNFQCADCGKPAQEWSYNGGCPHEVTEVMRGVTLAYSPLPSAYSPRCKRCHRLRDKSLVRNRDALGRWSA